MTSAFAEPGIATLTRDTGWLTVVRGSRREIGAGVAADESDDDWLSTGEAAKVAGVSRWKILRDTKEGRLKSRPLPGTDKKNPENRYRRRDVKVAYGLLPDVDVHELRRDVDKLREEHDALARRVDERGGDHS